MQFETTFSLDQEVWFCGYETHGSIEPGTITSIEIISRSTFKEDPWIRYSVQFLNDDGEMETVKLDGGSIFETPEEVARQMVEKALAHPYRKAA